MMVFRLAASAAALSLAAPLAAQNVTADLDRVAAILKAQGYPVTAENGPQPRIRTKMGGYPVALLFYGCDEQGTACKSIQLYAAFVPKTRPSLEAMNAYARKNRWGRVYLDNDSDPAIEMDLDLEAGGMSEALFVDNIAYWLTILDNFATFVFKDE